MAQGSTLKKILLVIDKDRKRRESMPAPDLRINGERLKTLDINDYFENTTSVTHLREHFRGFLAIFLIA